MVVIVLLIAPIRAMAQDWHASAPYQCNFGNTVENGAWVLLNGDSTVANKWYIDTAVGSHSGDGKALYISNMEGTTYSYDNSIASSVIAYRDFSLSQGLYTVAFGWNGVGEQNYDVLIAALVPEGDSTTLIGSTELPRGVSSLSLPEGWINLGAEGARIIPLYPLWS